eukprot:gnl/TRDRNA2_/TRDRNA2_129425_c0_seq1.p1 gnl/TRDRNA2_/TRDRNA2_129425_c0~~gnl/TRDRNA2_/TRDRNA2_129425_c0_seq1.p1  ORF type:complete len:445 (+),score=54.97 gnl/TRDRNA2_/TRDRNA2_129425_c0_seq1:84-1337(+)
MANATDVLIRFILALPMSEAQFLIFLGHLFEVLRAASENRRCYQLCPRATLRGCGNMESRDDGAATQPTGRVVDVVWSFKHVPLHGIAWVVSHINARLLRAREAVVIVAAASLGDCDSSGGLNYGFARLHGGSCWPFYTSRLHGGSETVRKRKLRRRIWDARQPSREWDVSSLSLHEIVEMRDGSGPWRQGHVMSLHPLHVQELGDEDEYNEDMQDCYVWDEVRGLQDALGCRLFGYEYDTEEIEEMSSDDEPEVAEDAGILGDTKGWWTVHTHCAHLTPKAESMRPLLERVITASDPDSPRYRVAYVKKLAELRIQEADPFAHVAEPSHLQTMDAVLPGWQHPGNFFAKRYLCAILRQAADPFHLLAGRIADYVLSEGAPLHVVAERLCRAWGSDEGGSYVIPPLYPWDRHCCCQR